jgi:RimJ/RimL family protein N-acetyltransferase
MLRPLRVDRAVAFAIHSDSDTYRFSPSGPMTIEAIDQMFDQRIAHWDRRGFGFWSIRALEANAILGFGGVMCHPSTAERDDLVLYYRFRPEHWGLGYATEVAQEAIDVAFRLVKAPRGSVETKSRPRLIHFANAASVR